MFHAITWSQTGGMAWSKQKFEKIILEKIIFTAELWRDMCSAWLYLLRLKKRTFQQSRWLCYLGEWDAGRISGRLRVWLWGHRQRAPSEEGSDFMGLSSRQAVDVVHGDLEEWDKRLFSMWSLSWLICILKERCERESLRYYFRWRWAGKGNRRTHKIPEILKLSLRIIES